MFARKLWYIAVKTAIYQSQNFAYDNFILINCTTTTGIFQQQLQVGRSKRALNIDVTRRLAVKNVAIDREILGSIPGPVKSDTVSPIARYRCVFSSELCCPGAE